MPLRRRKIVEPLRDGRYRLNIESDARTLIARLAGELRDVVMRADPSSEALRRLFPVAYHTDPDADAEYQRLMREELVASRLASVETILAALRPDETDAPELTSDELYALMQSLNALRLLLGTMLDVGEDDAVAIDETAEDAGARYLYDYLSWLLDHIVHALSGAL